MLKAVETRAHFVEEIRAAEKQCIEGILSMGRTLVRAKQALAHGEFTKMIELDLSFDASTAQRLMNDSRIEKSARAEFGSKMISPKGE